MSYTLTLKDYSDGTATLTLTSTETISTAFQIRAKAYSDNAGTQYVDGSGWATPPSSSTEMDFTLSIANPGTYYVTVESDEPATLISLAPITIPDDTPKTATQTQWEDLAGRIKAKSDVQITMTTTDPGEGSALPANHYIAVYGGDPIIMDYSTTEINTGARWIDGSAIYKKTINFGAVTANTPASVNHNISSLGIFVRSEAWGSSGNVQDGYLWYPIPWISPSGGINFTVTGTEIEILSYLNLDQCYVTLYYTKSS